MLDGMLVTGPPAAAVPSRVVAWTDRVAERLSLDPAVRRSVRWGAYLHDIGKLAVPDAILLEPGRLNDRERERIREHAAGRQFDPEPTRPFLDLESGLPAEDAHPEGDHA